VLAFGSTASGARYADALVYYEPGQNVDVVYGSDPIERYDNAHAALGGPGEQVALSQGTLTNIISLGSWTDDNATGTNSQSPGLVVGFTTEVLNGPGNDLLIVGNAPSSFSFHEPGFVEVAIESDGGGAKTGGHLDETFYLIKPGNYDQIIDPRAGSNAINITNNPDFSLTYSSPFDDPGNLPGYFDVTAGGDTFDLDDAVDAGGNPVGLSSIAYVRMRSVSDSGFPFGTFISPEVDYLEVLEATGDYNADGFVGLDDLDIVLDTWNETVASGAYSQGDANADGFVGLDDLDLVLNHWNTGTPPTADALPEPTAFALFAGLLIASLYRH